MTSPPLPSAASPGSISCGPESIAQRSPRDLPYCAHWSPVPHDLTPPPGGTAPEPAVDLDQPVLSLSPYDAPRPAPHCPSGPNSSPHRFVQRCLHPPLLEATVSSDFFLLTEPLPLSHLPHSKLKVLAIVSSFYNYCCV